jgi:uncharacterized protein YukE
MTGLVETQVEGNPTACLSAAGSVRGAHQALDDAEDNVYDARSRAADSWQGAAGKAFYGSVTRTSQHIADIAAKMQVVEAALTSFADELTVVRSGMAYAREVAVASGLTVVGTQIQMPATIGPAGQEADAGYEQRVAGWNKVTVMVDDSRRKEAEAHGNLSLALDKAMGDGVVEKVLQFLGFVPQNSEAADTGNWLVGLGGLAFGAGVSVMVTTRRACHRPIAGTPTSSTLTSGANGQPPASGVLGPASSLPPVSPRGTNGRPIRRIPRWIP